MARRGSNIYKRKDGRWEGRFIKEHYAGGKARYGYVYGKSYREAKEKLIFATAGQAKESDFSPKKRAVTFLELSGEWILLNEINFKESTSVKYRNMMRSYILPYLGEKCVQEIDHRCLEAFCSMLLEKGGKGGTRLSAKTVSDALTLVKKILQFAVNKGIAVPCDIHSITVKQNSRKMRILSLSEQQRLFQYLYNDLTPCNFGILLCLFTGMRIGEICALKWEDISISERIIFVHRTMQRLQINEGDKKTKILISTPKSDCSIREIPLPDTLFGVAALHARIPEAFVLTGEPGRYMEPRTLQNRFKSILKVCGICDATFHTLRHTFASRCMESGFDVKSLSEILGHANVNITLNRYVHPSMNLKRQNMNVYMDHCFAFLTVK